MGILNMTPDSFSDGGNPSVAQAMVRAEAMVQAGASIIDVGGESTRPGAVAVPAPDELARVLPIVEALTQRGLPAAISIDTYKASVAQAALDAGAHIVNDISAMGDPDMPSVVARAGATVVLMHSRGTPETMQDAPAYADVVEEVGAALRRAVEKARTAGVDHERIWLDPGLGFGKTFEHNMALIKQLGRIASMGYPVLLGASRKRFLGTIVGEADPSRRDLATAVLCALVAQRSAAQVFRVHNVAATREALAVAQALA